MTAGQSSATELSTLAAGGTPWKGRLRSHHTTPQSFPVQRLPSQTNNLGEEEDLQTLKKQAASKKTVRGCQSHARAVRQFLRLDGRDSEHPIVIDDEVNEEYKVSADQAAIMFRRSPRFHVEDKSLAKPLLPSNHLETLPNRKSKNAHLKEQNQDSLKSDRRNSGLEPLSKMKRQNEPQLLCQDPRGITPRKNIADASNKKSKKKELMPTNCKVLTGKRKRGTKRRLSSKKQSCQEPKPLPTNHQEIAPFDKPRKSIHRRIEKEPSILVKPKSGDEELTNIDENISKPSGTERKGVGKFCSSDDWTKEQDMALRKAYFTARPSPHFWKTVSKMVPGRSAEDCYNRIHADLTTPTPIAPRPRTSKTTFSPIGNFTLSDPKLLEPRVARQRTAKQKGLAAQKTVRHLLQKHCVIDQAQEADHFSVFESSLSALQLNLSFDDSHGTPDSYTNSGSLGKCSGSSSARKKPFSRLRTKPSEPSPEVLKPIKNVILHEKYIDQLSRREYTKRLRKRTPGSKAADSEKALSEQKAGSVKAAKNALISEATDFISSFKKVQAYSLAHIVKNSEDGIECDASDYSHDDKD